MIDRWTVDDDRAREEWIEHRKRQAHAERDLQVEILERRGDVNRWLREAALLSSVEEMVRGLYELLAEV